MTTAIQTAASGKTAVACRNPAKIPEPTWHPLDRVPVPIEVWQEAVLLGVVGLRWNVQFSAAQLASIFWPTALVS
jgi:hypothetical protein